MIQTLNGLWKVGLNRTYAKEAPVPGLPYPVDVVPEANVWYKRTVTIPRQAFRQAALVLCGAKYAPTVYVNGVPVSHTGGGMARTVHPLPGLAPGSTVELEVELQTVETMDPADASCPSESDSWRGDRASHIWDDVELVYYNGVRLDYAAAELADGAVCIHYRAAVDAEGLPIRFLLCDGDACVASAEATAAAHGKVLLTPTEALTLWTPDAPKRYRLVCEADGATWEQDVGFKQFTIEGKHFRLNGAPCTLRMGTVVWHKCYRDAQFMDVAYDTDWFYENIIRRLKASGANALRFHLGNPPRRMLDLCDRHGLLTQIEWSFFHEVEASPESLLEQYETWIGDALQHASAAIIHPWNEVKEGPLHGLMIGAVEQVEPYLPPFVLSHRDTIHIHAYWWSLFENLGLYYDSFEDFPKPVVADEFGGNYLDYEGNFGGYPHVRNAMMRFLGAEPSLADRIWLNTVSAGKVAEYWRRIGVAGFSPFVILSGPEDGNTHFFGSLKDPAPMPVWEALKPAYRPVAVSMDLWDRNFEPGEHLRVPLHVCNDSGEAQHVTVRFGITEFQSIPVQVPAYAHAVVEAACTLPEVPGRYTVQASVGDAVSAWDVIVHEKAPSAAGVRVGVLPEEAELRAFLAELGAVCTDDWEDCDLILGLSATYARLKTDEALRKKLEARVRAGQRAALLACGPMDTDLRDRDDVRPGMVMEALPLFEDLTLRFTAAKDGESHIHPTAARREGFWLWNGLRGGLIVPAVQMEVEGLSRDAFLQTWAARGADPAAIEEGHYAAYECLGLYEFAHNSDAAPMERLRRRVQALLDDAPALLAAGMPDVVIHPLSETWAAMGESTDALAPLALAGYALKRVPLAEVRYGSGVLILGQLLLDGRLTGTGVGIAVPRRDPAARRMVADMVRG